MMRNIHYSIRNNSSDSARDGHSERRKRIFRHVSHKEEERYSDAVTEDQGSAFGWNLAGALRGWYWYKYTS